MNVSEGAFEDLPPSCCSSSFPFSPFHAPNRLSNVLTHLCASAPAACSARNMLSVSPPGLPFVVSSDWMGAHGQAVKEFTQGRTKEIEVNQLHYKGEAGRTAKERRRSVRRW